jgi:hypothetical protein
MTDFAVTSPRTEVLKFLLHEAAHALNDGREPYHTKAFGALAAPPFLDFEKYMDVRSVGGS